MPENLEPVSEHAITHVTDPLVSNPALDGWRAAVGAAAPSIPFEARFQDLSELARGGQGRVLIGRDAVLQREVALKELLSTGGESASRRFEREALLTARLQHPGIVSIYELVRRSTGEPVLVMRRVHGEPLDKAIARAGTYEQRLSLLSALTAACDAIAYAHQQGVIHRDIKASNVLVGDFGDTVVIDWGIAKVLTDASPDGAASASEHAALLDPQSVGLTAPGAVVGTPAYMSPEQARGDPADAQSDVYALGALLYQLISGRLPYEGKNSLEVLTKVRAGPPVPVTQWTPHVAPELASMVARAMAPEKAHRYASAGELSEELKRFQTGRLVRSHSYSSWELLRRWAQRNAVTLSVSAIFLLVLASVGVVSVRRVLAERERANREAATAGRVSAFMTDMFKVSDPSVSRGNSVTAREILDKAAAQIGSNLAADPAVRARLLESMGTVYSNLGLYPQAQGPLEEANKLLVQELGPDNPESLNAGVQVVIAMRRQSKFKEAEPLALDLAARATKTLGPASEVTLEAQNQLGIIYRKLHRPTESEKTLRSALDIATRTFGPEHNLTLQLTNNLATAEGALDKHAEEAKLLEALVATRKKVNGPDAPETLGPMNNLGGTYFTMGRVDEAIALFKQVVEADKRVLGPDHPDTVNALGNVAAVLYGAKRFAEVEPIAREVLAGRERRLGPDNPETLEADNDLGRLMLDLKRPDEAGPFLEKARAGMEKLHRDGDQMLAAVIAHQAELAAQQGQKAEAVQLLKLSFDTGLAPPNQLETVDDPLLDPLRGDPDFEALASGVKAKAGANKKP